MSTARTPRRPARGFSLIDVLVGIVIALVAVLVIFQIFSDSEQFKRNVTSVGDAQVTGLLSSFTLALQLANSGSAIGVSTQDLDACTDPADPNAIKNFAKSWRPVPVMVVDSGSPDIPDSFAVNLSTATTIFSPALVISASAGKYVVQSPNGFHPKVAGEKKDLIVAIERPPFGAKGQCAPARVDGVKDMSGTCDGCVELAFTGTGLAAAYSVFNMGGADDAQKVLYDVDTAKNVLRSTRLVDDQGALSAAAPVPLASNVVNLKVQYGIDTNADGLLDSWVSGSGVWAPDKLMSAPISRINQIKAIRIGVIVRSEQFDKNFNQDVAWSLFGGAFTGTFPKSVAPPGNWRYRVYETTIPLRNSIWNPQT